MMAQSTRREILRQAGLHATAVWALLAQDHKHNAEIAPPTALQFFTAEQAGEIEALAAQIIPDDETPGAKAAGVIYFIDILLARFEPESQSAYLKGLEQLSAEVMRQAPGTTRLSALDAPGQLAVARSLEKAEFFELVRTHTIMGFLSHPQYGGNRNKAGWELIGFEDNYAYQPPFGYYDRPEGNG